ncbi:hypothetical protein QUF50_04785 [Thiotrichales bacterium HSG1]|nr:hypothetical protein [Thiotrichales bacterium HSG1]
MELFLVISFLLILVMIIMFVSSLSRASRNSKFKFNQNRFSQAGFAKLLMSPTSNYHGRIKIKISNKLSQILANGEVISKCSIQTSDGVKVAGVV